MPAGKGLTVHAVIQIGGKGTRHNAVSHTSSWLQFITI